MSTTISESSVENLIALLRKFPITCSILEAIEPVLSIFVRMTIDQIMAVTENTGLEELRKRPMGSPLADFNLQAEEGIAVENEIRGRQEGADSNEDYFPSVPGEP